MMTKDIKKAIQCYLVFLKSELIYQAIELQKNNCIKRHTFEIAIKLHILRKYILILHYIQFNYRIHLLQIIFYITFKTSIE